MTADATVPGHVRIAVIDSARALGRSLVKQWIDAMGGAGGCESEPGRGTTFWLSQRRA